MYFQEFIPRGRQAVEEHPGPTVTKQSSANASATEHLLMHRMQNVNISNDENPTNSHSEFWSIAELYDGDEFMSDFVVNSEQELYFKGNTAVWTRGTGNEVAVLPRKCFTCETPIRHAFFCPGEFIRTDAMDVKMKERVNKSNPIDSSKKHNASGICLIGIYFAKFTALNMRRIIQIKTKNFRHNISSGLCRERRGLSYLPRVSRFTRMEHPIWCVTTKKRFICNDQLPFHPDASSFLSFASSGRDVPCADTEHGRYGILSDRLGLRHCLHQSMQPTGTDVRPED